jgi:hypothetical protein
MAKLIRAAAISAKMAKLMRTSSLSGEGRFLGKYVWFLLNI